jgi:hypothetical protein
MRDTSFAAYESIKGSLPRMYREIWSILANCVPRLGAMTSLEIDREAERQDKKIEADKRMAEMVRQDLVEECDERACSVSGRKALTYKVTMRPRKKDARTKKQTMAQELAAARKTIKDLEAKLAKAEKLNADLSGKTLVDQGMGGSLFDNRKHD